jgi:IMP dehydrogenase
VVGTVPEVLGVTLAKLRATMCNLGSLDLREFSDNATLTMVSEQSIVEGGTSNIIRPETTFGDRE